MNESTDKDACDLLDADHIAVKHLFVEYARLAMADAGSAGERRTLADQICSELTVHAQIEEEIFYPALREHPKAKDIVLEAYEEHDVVDTILGELETTDVTDETWGAKFKVMKENLEHHIEEEEGEMFKQARYVFETDELDELGERMMELKTRASQEIGLATTASAR